MRRTRAFNTHAVNCLYCNYRWISTDIPHFRLRPTKTWQCRHGPTSGNQNVSHQNRSGNNVSAERAGQAVSAATPTFVPMPDSDMALATWPDIGRHLTFKIAATETGSRKNFWTEIDFDAVSAATSIFEHARLRYDTADIARYRPTSGTHNVGHKNRKWK